MYSDIRKIDLNLLVALKVLLEEHNVSRAAERLALTQPTVSGMLSRLRHLFNDPLFVRTQHGMIPTARAQELAPALENLLRDAVSLIRPRDFVPETLEADLRISATDYIQATLIPPLIDKLRTKSPKVRLAVSNLEISGLTTMLAGGEIDLAITIPEFADPALQTLHLYHEEYVCAVKASHPVRSSSVSMERFLEHDHILVSPAGGSFKGPVDEVLARQSLSRRVALSVPNFLVLLEVLRHEDLIATVPRRLLHGRLQGLRTFKPPIELQGFDNVAAWHARSDRDPAHQWLRDRLCEVAAELA